MLMVVALRYIDKVQPSPADPWAACAHTDRTSTRPMATTGRCHWTCASLCDTGTARQVTTYRLSGAAKERIKKMQQTLVPPGRAAGPRLRRRAAPPARRGGQR
jgi:hypothetical protein